MPRYVTASQKEEIVRLRIEEKLTAPQIAKKVGVSNQTAYLYTQEHPLSVEDMHARRLRTVRAWSAAEIRTLRRVWPTKDRGAIQTALPKRSWQAISRRAVDEGIHRPRIISHKKKRIVDPIFIELRAIREAQNMIREELSERVGIHRQMISHFELGATKPRWDNFRAWVEALDCDVRIVPRSPAL